mmetsp:Transcript_51416/g.88498  ORF Transcript_51416/g.88498 Transcript_51416/m.88498 type:complete len:106 (-) Transcript_51416:640-957(-)
MFFVRTNLYSHSFITSLPLTSSPLSPRHRVLELGAGTGIVGLALARMGAAVTLTDRAPLAPLLRRNAARNFPAAGARAAMGGGRPPAAAGGRRRRLLLLGLGGGE